MLTISDNESKFHQIFHQIDFQDSQWNFIACLIKFNQIDLSRFNVFISDIQHGGLCGAGSLERVNICPPCTSTPKQESKFSKVRAHSPIIYF